MEEVEGRIQTTVEAEVKKTIHVQLKEKWFIWGGRGRVSPLDQISPPPLGDS